VLDIINKIMACQGLIEIFVNFWLVGVFIVIEGFCIYALLLKKERGAY